MIYEPCTLDESQRTASGVIFDHRSSTGDRSSTDHHKEFRAIFMHRPATKTLIGGFSMLVATKATLQCGELGRGAVVLCRDGSVGQVEGFYAESTEAEVLVQFRLLTPTGDRKVFHIGGAEHWGTGQRCGGIATLGHLSTRGGAGNFPGLALNNQSSPIDDIYIYIYELR